MGTTFKGEVWFEKPVSREAIIKACGGSICGELSIGGLEWSFYFTGSHTYQRTLDSLPTLAKEFGPLSGHIWDENEGDQVVMEDGRVEPAKQAIYELLPDGTERLVPHWMVRWVPKETRPEAGV